jgi:MerR family transcriptional regulator/heat shock protein HspR
MPEIDLDKPLYPIGVVAEILGIPQRILRAYEVNEVIKPSRTYSNRRLYSQNDIQKIEYIHYLTSQKKVNRAGVKVIFDLLDKLRDEEREKLMADFTHEIKSMGEEKKKILQEEARKMTHEMMENKLNNSRR